VLQASHETLTATPASQSEPAGRVETVVETDVLLNGASCRPLFEFLAYTGLRISEALGLRWRDVDYDARVLRVEQRLGRDRRPKRLKTPAAKREVILAPSVAGLLRERKEVWPDRSGDDLVFCTTTGRPYGHHHAGEAFRAAMRRAGLRGNGRLVLHSLRHTFASMLIAAGLNVVFVSRQLGHANPSITLRIYAHLYAQADHAHTARAAIEASHGTLTRTVSAPPAVLELWKR
jgi:integrase